MAVLPPDPIYILRCPEMGPVSSLCFHQNERILAGTSKGRIYLFDLQTNRGFLNFDLGTEPVTSLHHADEILFTQEKGGRIRSWSITNTGYLERSSIETNHVAFCRSIYMPEQDLLLFPKEESTICLISNSIGTTDKITQEFKVGSDSKLGHVSCLKGVDMNGQIYVLAGYESGDILTWDVRSSKILNEQRLQGFPCSLDYDPITNRGICGGSDDYLSIFNINKQSMELKKLTQIGIKNPGVNILKLRQDQKVFVTAGWDGRIRIFSWKSLRPLAVLTEHKNGGVMDIAFSTGKVSMWKANIMAAGGADGQITLWDLYN